MSSLATELGLRVNAESSSKGEKLIQKLPTQKLKQTNSILEQIEYFTKRHQNRSLQF